MIQHGQTKDHFSLFDEQAYLLPAHEIIVLRLRLRHEAHVDEEGRGGEEPRVDPGDGLGERLFLDVAQRNVVLDFVEWHFLIC